MGHVVIEAIHFRVRLYFQRTTCGRALQVEAGGVFESILDHLAIAFNCVQFVVVYIERRQFAHRHRALADVYAHVEEAGERDVGLGVVQLHLVNHVDQGGIGVACLGAAHVDFRFGDGSVQVLFGCLVVGIADLQNNGVRHSCGGNWYKVALLVRELPIAGLAYELQIGHSQ